MARFQDGGNNPYIYETRYIFRESGSEIADFTAVSQIAAKLLPANMTIRMWTDDYAAMTYAVEAARNDLHLPLVSVKERGRIIVKYRFIAGRAVVTSAKFEPYSLE